MVKPYTTTWYNPKKRKPLLQLRILKTLAIRGKLSKMDTQDFFKKHLVITAKTRPHYPEISDAYDALLDKELVERLGESAVKGRPYRLKEKGLQVLISECKSFEECWRYVIGYSIHVLRHFDLIGDESLDKIVDMLFDRFLPYKSVGVYSNILETFNLMSKNLITELKRDSFIADLLIILSKKKDMTIKEIELKTGKDESTVKRAIQMLSMDCSNFSDHDPYVSITGDYYFEDPYIVRLRYIDFLTHMLIFYYDRNDTRYYHTSLFGVLFLITMLSQNDINLSSTQVSSGFEIRLNLFASAYSEKLPLIFNEWALLRKYLNLLTMYNFEFIIYDNEQISDVKRDVVKDYDLIKDVDAMRSMNNLIAQKILAAGTESLKEITKNDVDLSHIFAVRDDDDIIKIKDVCNTWERYLYCRTKFFDIPASVNSIFNEIRRYRPISGRKICRNTSHYDNDIEPTLLKLEKVLQHEVTLTYYLNLIESSHNILLIGEELGRSDSYMKNGSIEIEVEGLDIRLNPLSPRERLKAIMSKSDEIRHFILTHIEDSAKYREQEFQNIQRLSSSLVSDIKSLDQVL